MPPTKKQIDYATNISEKLGIEFPTSSLEYNKRTFYLFIQKYEKEYKDALNDADYDVDYVYENFCENDAWCEHY